MKLLALLLAIFAAVPAVVRAEVVLSNLANLSAPEYNAGAYEVEYSFTDAYAKSWWGGAFHAGADASLDSLRLELAVRGTGNPRIRLFRTGTPVPSFGFFAFGVDPLHPDDQVIPDFFPPGSPPQLELVGNLEYRDTPVGPGVQVGTGIYDFQPDAALPLEAGRDYVFLLTTDPTGFTPDLVFGDAFVLTSDPLFASTAGFGAVFTPFIYQSFSPEYYFPNDPPPAVVNHFWHPDFVAHAIKFELDVSNLSVIPVPEASSANASLGLLGLGAIRWLRRRG